jgi:ferredoxin-type protein NapH
MKEIKKIGLVVFLLGLTFFTSLPFFGKFNVSQRQLEAQLTAQEWDNIGEELSTAISGKEYSTSAGLSHEIIAVYESKNAVLKANQEWDKVMCYKVNLDVFFVNVWFGHHWSTHVHPS